jgi:hypothetical protein
MESRVGVHPAIALISSENPLSIGGMVTVLTGEAAE